jgi:hypothetical protein
LKTLPLAHGPDPHQFETGATFVRTMMVVTVQLWNPQTASLTRKLPAQPAYLDENTRICH